MVKHKFYAKPTTTDGIRFDSKAESAYYKKLKIAQSNGDLVFFLRQVPFDLPGNTKYRADFMEFWADGEIKIVDVKGFDTPQSKMKRKQVEDLYPIIINIVTTNG